VSFWDSQLPLGWGYEAALRVILAGGCVAFIIRYWMTNKWWKNDFGRHLVSMSASLGLLGLFSLAVLVWPDLPARGLIRMVLFTLLASAVLWRIVVFERYQKARKREIRERL
jgi:hypothetical protein